VKLKSSRGRVAAAFGAALLVQFAAPAFAASANVELLQDYIGDWRGRGVLIGAETESVVCRLSLSKGNDEKVNYNGRCSLAGTNLTVSGSMAWNDGTKRYEAAMTTNATFAGVAIGKRQGDALVFNLREQDKDENGNDLTITADIALRKEKISVDFSVLFNESGDTLKASVPFSR